MTDVNHEATGDQVKTRTMNDGKWIETELMKNDNLLASYTQQACCAKLLGAMAVYSQDLAEKMVEYQAVSGLLSCISNVANQESQMNAVDTLLHLIELFPRIGEVIIEEVGEEFYEGLKENPDTIFKELTKEQIKFLNRNAIKMRGSSKVGDMNNNPESVMDALDKLVDVPEDKSFVNDPEMTEYSFAVSETRDLESEMPDDIDKDMNRMTTEDDSKDSQVTSEQTESKLKNMYTPFSIPPVQSSLVGSKYQGERMELEMEALALNEIMREKKSNVSKKIVLDKEFKVTMKSVKEDMPNFIALKENNNAFRVDMENILNEIESPERKA
ncbi:hypothetical protein ROZALSC1DRAFT_28151 [Rozella allomycis CSF55]|uniref:Uncharacterized protein n=1 Tax=Rozella allomycis (strain CSF55) TaxID=988480 RepID=A0A075ATS0_ROZAC|nr:hypothetical protein O9G_000418 [Rozella allomycis CSF55]RKP20347.1 hypothetical protein ROZALSC1DRAFT_28151 [Rozella allomycis CSF55]|eukprot:EPZ33643.1 hypothetical protein O9G_000418 [Rozella allomycis CSF55]